MQYLKLLFIYVESIQIVFKYSKICRTIRESISSLYGETWYAID